MEDPSLWGTFILRLWDPFLAWTCTVVDWGPLTRWFYGMLCVMAMTAVLVVALGVIRWHGLHPVARCLVPLGLFALASGWGGLAVALFLPCPGR